ncbi:unnamed protein product [Meloidogyne enterolobii]|uniref:Uncharacterized protein n=1 Tax=Meloidogyne enterolobii TaxID=390850 RepID=A0ACB1B3Y1_MELEN
MVCIKVLEVHVPSLCPPIFSFADTTDKWGVRFISERGVLGAFFLAIKNFSLN